MAVIGPHHDEHHHFATVCLAIIAHISGLTIPGKRDFFVVLVKVFSPDNKESFTILSLHKTLKPVKPFETQRLWAT